MTHPGNNKQSVPLALAMSQESTTAAIKSYFPNRLDAANSLTIFYNVFVNCNSKQCFNTSNQLGNAEIQGDCNPEFLLLVVDWIETWSKCPSFTLTKQTSHALWKHLDVFANLIDDLLNENYDYILTSRFQSDPIEHHFSKYRKVSEGRFLVSLREVKISEKILLLNSIIKADLNFWEEKFRQRYVRASHSAQRNGKWNFRMSIKWRKQRSGCIESKLCGKDLFYTIGL